MAEEKLQEEDNVIFIGSKPFMNYVTSINMQFMTKGMAEVIIKARGKFINRAVDIAEFIRKKFLKEKNIKIKEIKIDSSDFENKKGKLINVSTIEIVLTKN